MSQEQTTPTDPVGRDLEVARIRDLMTTGNAVLLEGDAGVGKSTLVTFLADHEDGPVVHLIAAEQEREVPYAAVIDLFDQLHSHHITPDLASVPHPHGSEPENWFRVAADALTAVRAIKPTVTLLIDDAHWLDDASVKVLSFVARRSARHGIRSLIATRPHQQFDSAGLCRVELTRLSDDAAAHLLERVAPDLDPTVRDSLLAAAAGWPLALVELPRSLDSAQRAGREPLPRHLPPGPDLHRLFASRIDGVSEAARLALLVVATSDAGRVHIVDRALTHLGGGGAGEFAELADAQLLTFDSDRWTPSHPLLRAAVYHAASPADRRRVHGAIADALSDSAVTTNEHRAWHLAAAAQGPDQALAAVLEELGDQANARAANGSAGRCYRSAAELTTDPAERGRLLCQAANAFERLGDYTEAGRLATAADDLIDDPGLKADALLVIVGVRIFREAIGPLLRRMLRVAVTLGDADLGRAIRLLAYVASVSHASDEIELAESAAERAADMIETDLPGFGHYMRGLARAHQERWPEAVAELESSLDWMDGLPGRDLTDGAGERSARAFCGPLLATLGDVVMAERAITPVVVESRANGALGVLSYSLTSRAEVRYRSGRWRDAEQDAADGVELMEDLRQHGMLVFGYLARARVAAGQGRLEAAAADLERSRSSEGGASPTIIAMQRLAVHVTGLMATGRFGEAVAVVGAADLASVPGLLRGMTTVLLLPNWVEAGVRLGADWALAEAVTLGRRAEALGHHAALGAYLRCRGMLAGEGDADALFERALTHHNAGTDPLGTARTLLCRAESRRERGLDHSSDRRAAATILAQMDAQVWAETSRGRRCGDGDDVPATRAGRTPSSTSVDALTRAEWRVARAVSRGLTNQQTATELSISPKTVEFHLGNIYRKLGVGSRTQLSLLLSKDR